MMRSGQMPQNGPAAFGRLRLMMYAAILGGIALAAFFAVQLGGKISNLREAPRDNIQWNTAQLEVDFLKLRSALAEAADDPGRLAAFRRQYDVFYSRVKVVEGATQTLPVDQDASLRADRHVLDHFLMQTVGLVDSSDTILLAALPDIDAKLAAVGDAPRQFALGTVQLMAEISDSQRVEINDLLRRLALVTLFVIGALIVTFAAMTYQRLQLLRQSAALAQAGGMRESTLRASLDAIVVVDARGRITDFNGSAEKIFGYARGEIIGKKLAETIVPPAFREAHSKGFSNYTSPEKSGIVDEGRLELTALHKDGHEFPIEISISETSGPGGPNFVSYIRDITEEKLAKAELQQARDDALSAFREKSHFFAVMSHEMRTPLNGIMSALNLMRDDALSGRQERYVSIAETSSKVLLSHIDDVLLIERLDSDQNTVSLTSFRPAAVIDELAETMRPLAGQQNTVLSVAHDDPGIAVYGQSRAMRQVAMNLMSNAIKFTPSGKVTVRTQTRPAGDDLVALTVSVTDTGIGMSEADQARIFEDFVTVDSPYERTAAGTGLGLGIVRRLVRQMEGEVTCESRPGEGSTFRVTVTLPRVSAEAAEAAEAEQEAQEAPAKALSILVVEDNPINAEVLEAMLVRDGHKVALARDGFEGVHMGSRAFYDLILMDVSMPNMNGIKATQQLRASRGLSKDTPIYAVTAHAMPNEVEEFLNAGMSGCLLKPMRPDALRTVLNEVAAGQKDPGQDGAGQQDAGQDGDSGGGPAAPDGAVLIDAERIQDLADLLGPEKFGTKLRSFEAQSEACIEDMARAREDGSIRDLQRLAHQLAGACGVFGATGLHAELQALETLCKSGDRDGALEMAQQAAATWQATRRSVQRYQRA